MLYFKLFVSNKSCGILLLKMMFGDLAPSEGSGNLFCLPMQLQEMAPDHISGLQLYFHTMKNHLSKKNATTRYFIVLCIAMITL